MAKRDITEEEIQEQIAIEEGIDWDSYAGRSFNTESEKEILQKILGKELEESQKEVERRDSFAYNFIKYEYRDKSQKFGIIDLGEEIYGDQKIWTINFLANKKFINFLQDNIVKMGVYLGKRKEETLVFPYATSLIHGYKLIYKCTMEEKALKDAGDMVLFECIAYSKEIETDVKDKFDKVCKFDLPQINIEDEL